MFAWWGRTVYRYRFIVIGVMVALCLGGGVYGMSLGKHVTQSGFYDDGSESVKASVLGDNTYGRDRTSHIVAVLEVPKGKQPDDPEWSKKVAGELDTFQKKHSEVQNWVGYLKAVGNPDAAKSLEGMNKTDKDTGRVYTFISIPLNGNDDDTILNNYKEIAPDLQKINGGRIELAGLEPISEALTGTIGTDQKRMEVLALPLVAVVLFFVFGGVIAASLPVIVGGLSIAGSTGILRFASMFGPVHFFAQPVVSLIGLGIAIDYGLFVVSRFREEIAEGYDTEAAVRRSVMTAGRTVVFSAVLIIVSSAALLVMPQGFVKSLTYAIFAAVGLAALLSITLLPACLGVLGANVDALGVRTLYRVPFLRNWGFSNRIIGWFADKTQKTKTREEVENEFWGKLVNFVMKRPLAFAIPIVVAMILLIIPLGKLSFGGMSEKYLPPDNPSRVAQEHFDTLFPGYRTEQLTLVIRSTNGSEVTPAQVREVANKAAAISGFTKPEWKERPCVDAPNGPCKAGQPETDSVRVIQNGLVVRNDAAKKISELRAIAPPKGLTVWVGGTPALEQDSIHALASKGPLMLVLLITSTTLLMFLAFGSLVLPLKAAVMSALTLGSTMGILTWIFVDGHFSGLLNFTPTPLMVVVIALVVAVGWGLATDYEVFLVSRMVEARESGMSTTEAIRIGTATTGRLITAAALILAVVAGSFVFSDLVMMKYLAFGLMAALMLDATVIRMFLVPAVMKLLGDDCWWAPRWMKRVQTRIGLGEINLPDERKRPGGRRTRPALTTTAASTAGSTGNAPRPRPPHDPTHPGADAVSTGRPESRPQPPEPAEPPTARFSSADSAERPSGSGAPSSERDIESWLGALRSDPNTATTAFRSQKPADSRNAPEKTNTAQPPVNGNDANRQRRSNGGGLSAQDLLRREGRY